MRYLIGSRAIKKIFPDFPREPKDYDYLVETKQKTLIIEDKVEEYHINPILFKYISENGINADVLYTLKVSHIFWDIFWSKHMFDIVFLKEHGAKLIKPLFEDLYEYWNTIHSKNNRSVLDMVGEEFFNNALTKYDHDVLHTFINPNPLYFKVLKEGAEVDVSEEKFNLLSFEDKLELAREEVYVMAYERLFDRDYRVAFNWMLKKFIMNHAPMWFAIFIIENYRIMQKCNINYVEKIETHMKYNNNWYKKQIKNKKNVPKINI
jgi:hypothetical protein